MAYNDGVKVGPVAYLGLLGVLVTFALVLMLQVLYYEWRNSMQESHLKAEGPPPELTSLVSRQQNVLTKRGYVDRERGVVSIGISRAEQLVVKELAEGKQPKEVIGPPRAAEPAKSQGGGPVDEEAKSANTSEGEKESPDGKEEPNDEKKS